MDMLPSSPSESLSTSALQEIVDIYHRADHDDEKNPHPLSGADVVAELSYWIERNHKLLQCLGILSGFDVRKA